MEITNMSEEHLEECTDLLIDVFTNPPWNDTYSSRQQVMEFLRNHMNNNYFAGYVLKEKNHVIAMSVGMKKPWLNGMEYYIDQFCVKPDLQGKGIGSYFLKRIEEDIKKKNMNAIILNTERGCPAKDFYLKNDFKLLDDLITLAK